MLLKKIIGILIIILNTVGLGFVLYWSGTMIKNKLSTKKQIVIVNKKTVKKKKTKIANDNIIADEDDLLKDMDLSDLDSLNLDDFD